MISKIIAIDESANNAEWCTFADHVEGNFKLSL